MVNCYIFDGYDTGKLVISRVVENTLEVFHFPGLRGKIDLGDGVSGSFITERGGKSFMKEKIIEYLIKTYNPEAIITYGSYADGTANENSDFDALIVANNSKVHDESVVAGTTLDVFIYPPEIDIENIDMDEFIQIHDGQIELDKNGIASRLKERVLNYIENIPFKSEEEQHQEIEWCKKMALRTKRDDAEGYFRWHWLLMESLEIYFDIIHERYWGPKKSLIKLSQSDPEAYKIYEAALKNFSQETLFGWIAHLERTYSINENKAC